MNLSEEQQEDYQQQLDNLSEKDLLLEIMVELKTIRHYLSEAEPQSKTENKYRCMACSKIVSEDERTSHLVEQHNAPSELDPEMEFEAL